MTPEIEEAYDLGVVAAATLMRAVAAAMKIGDVLTSDGLMFMAKETERMLLIVDANPGTGSLGGRLEGST